MLELNLIKTNAFEKIYKRALELCNNSEEELAASFKRKSQNRMCHVMLGNGLENHALVSFKESLLPLLVQTFPFPPFRRRQQSALVRIPQNNLEQDMLEWGHHYESSRRKHRTDYVPGMAWEERCRRSVIWTHEPQCGKHWVWKGSGRRTVVLLLPRQVSSRETNGMFLGTSTFSWTSLMYTFTTRRSSTVLAMLIDASSRV